jgi:hypothetical protein
MAIVSFMIYRPAIITLTIIYPALRCYYNAVINHRAFVIFSAINRILRFNIFFLVNGLPNYHHVAWGRGTKS